MKALRLALGIALAAEVIGFSAEPKAAAKTETSKKPPRDTTTPADATRSAAPRLITTSMGGRDLQFLMAAAENGRLQSWLGEQAKKAESEQLRAYGDVIQGTQEEESRHLRDIASRNNVNTSLETSSSQLHKASTTLAPLKGPKFDKALVELFANATLEAVTVYETGIGSKDETIRRYSEQMLPIAKEKRQILAKLAGTASDSPTKPAFRGGASPSPGQP